MTAPDFGQDFELMSFRVGDPPQSSGGHATVPVGPYALPPLRFAYDALEPVIDAATMRLHHDQHHRAYVDGGAFRFAGTEQMTAQQDDQPLELLVAQILIAVHHISNRPVLVRGREAVVTLG